MQPTLKPNRPAIYFLWFGMLALLPLRADVVLPNLASNLICRYDFDHPVATNAAVETDLGLSATHIHLLNGGGAMRTHDGAHPGSLRSLQTRQVNPAASGNDDWKAGLFNAGGVASLNAFGAVTGITLMGWVKPTGDNPSPNTTAPAISNLYNAAGFFGLLSGDSQGHHVRALIELINVNHTLKLVALGRRIDGGTYLTLAATNNWQTLLPVNTWTHLAATFDFDNGVMALYRNGRPLPATNTSTGNPWNVTAGTDTTSAASPAGIKIGGSFPQNTQEQNPFNGRFDDLMFFNRALTAAEVQQQFSNFFVVTPVPAHIPSQSQPGSTAGSAAR